MSSDLRVTLWNEHRHEKVDDRVRAIYPEGMLAPLAGALRAAGGLAVRTVALDDPEQGLPDAVLNDTDVLAWWGHMAHGEVRDELVRKVQARIWAGMGLLTLHSGHFSKIFKALMGTSCDLKWRVAADREILWVTAPGHPIVRGLADHVAIPAEEMYGEHFDIPEPDETVMISSFSGGEVFRSCITFRRGAGRIVYFRPGHETFPTYHRKDIQQIIVNAVRWLAPDARDARQTYGRRDPV